MEKILLLVLVSLHVFAQDADKKKVLARIQQQESHYSAIAQKIWNFAEVGYKEKQSSALLQETLKQAGFTIESGVAGIPTAFVATYGQGKPVIGIMAEYDALPGLSQKNLPYKVDNNTRAGHGCGHHLFGTASAVAAIAVKNYLKEIVYSN